MTVCRVAFIGHSVHLAGAEIALTQFVTHLDRQRWSPLVILPEQGPICATLNAARIPLHFVPYQMTLMNAWDSLPMLNAVRGIHEMLLALRPEAIVVNTDVIPQAVIAALLTEVPILVHLHAYLDRIQYPHYRIDGVRQAGAMWLPFVDKILACSPWIAAIFSNLLGRDVTPIPNLTDLPHAVTPYAVRLSPTPQIAMLATLEPHKRPDLLIEALALIRRERPDRSFQAAIYGDGHPSYRQSLQKLIATYQLTEHVTLLARQSDIATIYNRCAVVVVPSDVEPFSMVTIEGAAYGCPVIATRSGGPDGLIVHNETGFLIERGDAKALAQHILLLLDRPEQAAALGRAAQQRYMTHYSPQSVMPLYEQALYELIQDAPLHRERRRLAQPMAAYFACKSA